MKALLERPVLALVVFLLVTVLGIYSFINLPLELLPDEKLPQLVVSVIWPNAAADVVLNRAVLPLEEELAGLREVKKIASESFQGRGQIIVDIDRDLNLDLAYILVKERINRIRKDLPPQIMAIDVTSYVPREMRASSFMQFAVSSDSVEDVNQLRLEFERDVLPLLQSLFGVKEVKVTGGSEVLIKIMPDLQKMELLGVSVRYLLYALQQNFATMPSVRVRDQRQEIGLALTHNPENLQKLSGMVLYRDAERRVLLSDVALVSFGYGDIRQEARLNGNVTLLVDVYKQPYSSGLGVDRRLKEVFARINLKYRQHYRFKVIESEGEKIARKLAELGKLAALILLVIFLFLTVIVRNLYASLLIFSAVIFSSFATLTIIYFLKISLNILTLSALAICFGMYVDNAVVVFDNIMLLRQKGVEKREAALQGSREVFFAVLASTLTTIIVFFSFALFQGRLRSYYLPVALVVSLALLSSVLVSYLLIPTFSFRLPLKFKPVGPRGRGGVFKRLISYPLFVLLPLLALTVFSALTFKEKVSFGRFFSWLPDENLVVYLEMPQGTTFDDIRKEMLNFEKEALAFDGEREISVNINENVAFMRVVFGRKTIQSGLPYLMRERLVAVATNLAGVSVGVWGFDPQGGYFSSSSGFSFLPYNIVLKGYNFDRLLNLSRELRETLLQNRRVPEVEIATSDGFSRNKQRFYQFTFRKERLNRYGPTPSYALLLLEQQLQTSQNYQRRLRLADKDYLLEFSARDRREEELQDILKKIFYTPEGRAFSFGDLLEVQLVTFGTESIKREEQEYYAKVSWDYLGSSKKAEKFFRQTFDALSPPPGFKKSEEERSWLLSEREERELKGVLLFALGLVIFILAVLYNSFWQTLIILSAIPLALVGIFWGFVVSGYSFDSAAYIGVVLVMGIVVNNAIIMVNHINVLRRDGMPLREAIAQGSRERIRPILMTTLTTVFGSALFVFKGGSGEDVDIWTTFALCNLTGLISSSLLIFFALPPLYDLVEKLRCYLGESFRFHFRKSGPGR